MEVPAEPVEQQAAPVEEGAEQAAAAVPAEAEEQAAPVTSEAKAPVGKKGENQKLLKKIDIDGMFKKFSPAKPKKTAGAKKTAVKGKLQNDIKKS